RTAGAPSTGFVEGRITDEEGNGLARVRVLARSDTLTASGQLVGAEGHTDEHGAYRIEGLGGAKSLSVDAYPDDRPSVRKYRVPVNSKGVDFELVRFAAVQGR